MIVFAVALPLWYLVSPVIASVSAFVAEPIVFLLDGDNLTRGLSSIGATILLDYFPTPTGKPFAISYRFVTYNTVLLLALIMAVPDVRPKLRLKILLLGPAILFPTQIAMLLVAIFSYYSTLEINGQPLYSSFAQQTLYHTERILTRVNGEVPPILIWAGLFFYYKWHRTFLKKTA